MTKLWITKLFVCASFSLPAKQDNWAAFKKFWGMGMDDFIKNPDRTLIIKARLDGILSNLIKEKVPSCPWKEVGVGWSRMSLPPCDSMILLLPQNKIHVMHQQQAEFKMKNRIPSLPQQHCFVESCFDIYFCFSCYKICFKTFDNWHFPLNRILMLQPSLITFTWL